MRRWFKGATRPALFLAVGLLGGAAAVAVAAVPSSSGVISACLEITTNQSGVTLPVSTGPNLRVIDTDAGQSCRTATAVGAGPQTLEQPISWNQSGPQGPQGPQGPSGAAGATGANGRTGASGGAAAASVLIEPPVTSTTPIGTVTIPLPTSGGKTENVALQVAGWSIQSGPTTYDKTTTTATTGNGKGSILLPIDGIAGESLNDSKAQQIEIRLTQVAGSGTAIPHVTLAVRDASTGMATGKRSPRLLRIKLKQVHIGEVAYDSKTTKGKGQPPVKETLTLSYNSFSVS
jgi:hypothetical protein